ncbi:hypothetical protein EDC01DRAFT_13816 [Geopyxis carbonaria]|nr:hypothetical protein EDC01DRAFT_13816 [Geopyxis carbonaria]
MNPSTLTALFLTLAACPLLVATSPNAHPKGNLKKLMGSGSGSDDSSEDTPANSASPTNTDYGFAWASMAANMPTVTEAGLSALASKGAELADAFQASGVDGVATEAMASDSANTNGEPSGAGMGRGLSLGAMGAWFVVAAGFGGALF